MAIRNITNVEIRPVFNGNWKNWAGIESSVAELYQPKNIKEIVAIIIKAESQNKRIRVVGSKWSFTGCARPDKDHITLDLSQIRGSYGSATFLKSLGEVRERLHNPRNSVVHVNAGVSLWQLNQDLWAGGFSMLTLGGSQGQTLAGALSTGTHGTDLEYSSVCDAVHAIHLIGSGGQEYWIERLDGITQNRMDEYPVWNDCIIRIQNDEVFNSALISLGRFGIFYRILLEVSPRYRIKEHRKNDNWLNFIPRLQSLKITGDLKSLDKNEIRSIKINLDPYGVGHGYFGSLVLRWNDTSPHSRDLPVEASSKGPDALAREIGASQALANGLLVTPGGTDIFAETARHFFKSQQSERLVLDRNYYVTSDKPTKGMGYEIHYKSFDQHGPFVNSMEYFFDGKKSDAENFINRVYREWKGFLGGYISIRFSKKSTAMIGPQQFEATVIVEVTIIQGYHDSQKVCDIIKNFASEMGAIPHWGQENLLTPPELQQLYDKRVSKWRKSLEKVTLVGKTNTFSNRHSRRMGLELFPAIMFKYNNQIKTWLDQEQGLFASTFNFFIPPLPSSLSFSWISKPIMNISNSGMVNGKIVPLTPVVNPGSLIIKRFDKTMAEIRNDGTFCVNLGVRFRSWMR